MEQSIQFLPLRRVDHIIGIEPERVIARGAGSAPLAPWRNRRPTRSQRPAPERSRDLGRSIRAAGIDDDNLVEEPTDRLEAMREVIFFVSGDHGEGDLVRRRSPLPLLRPSGRRWPEGPDEGAGKRRGQRRIRPLTLDPSPRRGEGARKAAAPPCDRDTQESPTSPRTAAHSHRAPSRHRSPLPANVRLPK